jgi:protein required for attachment to host cells
LATTWVLAADSSRARIFTIPNRRREINEIEAFVNPEGRANIGDLRAHGTLGPAIRHEGRTWQRKIDPVEHNVEAFSKQVGDYLEDARVKHRYDQLCLIAPPEFLGLLRQRLSSEVRKLVAKEIAKDLSRLDAAAILTYVRGERP